MRIVKLIFEIEIIKSCFFLLLIIIIGLFGNIINLAVFKQKSMRKNSTFKYLFYLSIIDILVLLICATDSLMTNGNIFSIRLLSNLTCKCKYFIDYFLTHLSSILIMIVSIDRAIIICRQSNLIVLIRKYPFFNLFKKVHKMILIIAVLIACLNLHFLIFMKLNRLDMEKNLIKQNHSDSSVDYLDKDEEATLKYGFSILKLVKNQFNTDRNEISTNTNANQIFVCYPKKVDLYYFYLSNIWIWLDIGVYSIIPFIVMSVCSLIIVKDIRRKSSAFIKTNKYNKNVAIMKICRKSRKRNNHLLMMLLFTNLFFIICSMPLCSSLVYYRYKDEQEETHSVQSIFHLLAYSNNSFNFVFYYIFSCKYRQTLSKLLFFRPFNNLDVKSLELNQNNADVINLKNLSRSQQE